MSQDILLPPAPAFWYYYRPIQGPTHATFSSFQAYSLARVLHLAQGSVAPPAFALLLERLALAQRASFLHVLRTGYVPLSSRLRDVVLDVFRPNI